MVSAGQSAATARLASWGGVRSVEVAVSAPSDHRDAALPSGPYLACGAGRTYGDSCLPVDGTAVCTSRMNAILAFDAQSGLLSAEAGATFHQILEHIVPHGWLLPVTPGTGFVTLGGAIANDVHGKNHHVAGTIGCFVESLELLRQDGRRHLCSPSENEGLFAATIGGMGLTGLITRADIRLMRVTSPHIIQNAFRFPNIDAYFDAERSRPAASYSVAWIDGMSSGRSLGRGVLLEGEHAAAPLDLKSSRVRLSAPFTPPFNLVIKPAAKLLNAVYSRQREGQRPVHYRPFFYPLDSVAHWNRLYGPRGFHQFQCVVPTACAANVLPRLLEMSVAAGGSPLAVLKRFGSIRSPGLLSFPMDGYTLTMDFADHGEATSRLIDKLEHLTLEHGGRINAYKSRHMQRDVFTASYPRWRELLRYMDEWSCSALSARLGLSPAKDDWNAPSLTHITGPAA